VRKINFFLLALLAMACASCGSRLSEVKPLLKPREVPIAQRIADQEKWLVQDVTAKTITAVQARPIRIKLEQIKKDYDRLKATGPLTHTDTETLNRALDQTSEQIFRISTKPRGISTH
jgi:hypothetical protein